MSWIVISPLVLLAALYLLQRAALAVAYRAAFKLKSFPEQRVERSESSGEPLRIILVGDDAVQGIGASDRSETVAARLTRSFPGREVSVSVLARRSARTGDLPELCRLAGRASLIILLFGANDLLGWRSSSARREKLEEALMEAATHAETVVLAGPPDVGAAPALWPPWNWLYRRRAKKLDRAFDAAALRHRVIYVSLFEAMSKEPRRNAKKLFAADRWHLNDQGYALATRAILAKLRK